MSERHVVAKRIYDPVADDDGARVLVDRVWPRGVSKDHANLNEWFKDVAPTTELRKWYGHDPDKYDEFKRRYLDELSGPEGTKALDHLRQLARQDRVTLLTASKALDISQAAVLASLLEDD